MKIIIFGSTCLWILTTQPVWKEEEKNTGVTPEYNRHHGKVGIASNSSTQAQLQNSKRKNLKLPMAKVRT